jgi:TolA protein
MRGSIVTSAALHAVILAVALLSLGAPPPLEVQPTEALPVDIVPIEELTSIQQGEKTAPLKEKSSPKATKRQDKVDNAENAGENNIDLKNPPTPSLRPPQTEVAAAPKPAEQPTPTQDVTNLIKDIQKEQTAQTPPPPSAVPTPKPEPTPPKPEPTPPKPEPAKAEPKPEPKPQETAKAEETPKPDALPVPSQKPVPEKPKQEEAKKETKPEDKPKPVEKPKTEQKDAKAETKPDKKTDTKADSKSQDKSETKTASVDSKPGKDKEKKETAKSAASRDTDKLADEVAALLNKEDSAGGGAKRSNQEASLGGKKTTGAGKLSQSELDALKGAIQNNWNVIPGMMDAQNIRIRVSFHLDRSGEIVGDPEVTVTGGEGNARDVLASSAKRAVLKSAPFNKLPADKYDTWSDVVVNFDPSDFM